MDGDAPASCRDRNLLVNRTQLPHIARRAAALLIVVATLTLTCDVAAADAGGGWVTCGVAGRPSCDVGARAPGSPAKTASEHPASNQAGSSPRRSCHDALGHTVPCYDPVFGWLGSDGCYYKPIPTPSAQDQAAWGGGGQGPGGWYDWTCAGLPGSGGGRGWVAGQPPGVPAPVDPAVLARQAVTQLGLPQPAIGMSPVGEQVVRVPTWLWLDSASWRSRSATATVPGVSVTATATPTQVVWSTGDGSRVTCHGPGTAWHPGIAPASASPTCGHTYLTGSSNASQGKFTVTATISWTVAWNGGGQAGTVPGLTTTSTAAIRVVEVQAVVTGQPRGT
jgi:hypothetical protein